MTPQIRLTVTILAAVSLTAFAGPDTEQATAATTPAAAQTSSQSAAAPAAAPAWHYEGAEGPAHWGTLSPTFAACASGRSQSPIDLSKPTRGATPEMRTSFPPAELRIVHHDNMADGINNGHTIQVDYVGDNSLTLGSVQYKLVQYHFHGPSEHTVNGKHFPMEMHMVHKAADGRLAVVGVLIAEGAHHKAFDQLWANLPAKKGDRTHFPAVKVNVDALLPGTRTSYRYAGSLTTPPCTEGVSWIVLTSPIQLSAEQIRAFTRLVKSNNRPVQMLNGRTILTDAVSLNPGGGAE